MSQNLKLNEVFYSIQGEGPYAGYPATFVRLAGCKEPYCHFCDTKYVWTEGNEISSKDLLDLIKLVQKDEQRSKYVVFTGGEPLLQYNELAEIISELTWGNWHIGWETSLKVYNDNFKKQAMFDRVSISPKFIDERWQVHSDWKELHILHDLCAKFLVDNIEDVNRALEFAVERNIPRDQIWLMPYGSIRGELILNSKKVWQWALEFGLKFCPRLQVYVYGSKKGV
jgi:7-carboxy-7-deazaguanine synthase